MAHCPTDGFSDELSICEHARQCNNIQMHKSLKTLTTTLLVATAFAFPAIAQDAAPATPPQAAPKTPAAQAPAGTTPATKTPLPNLAPPRQSLHRCR